MSPNEREERLLELVVCDPGPIGVRTVKDEVADALRMFDRVGERNGPSLRDSKQRQLFWCDVIDEAFEHLNLRLKRDLRSVSIGQPAAVFVVANQRVFVSQGFKEETLLRVLPVELKVAEPVSNVEQYRPLAGGCIGDTNSFSRREESDLLLDLAPLSV